MLNVVSKEQVKRGQTRRQEHNYLDGNMILASIIKSSRPLCLCRQALISRLFKVTFKLTSLFMHLA